MRFATVMVTGVGRSGRPQSVWHLECTVGRTDGTQHRIGQWRSGRLASSAHVRPEDQRYATCGHPRSCGTGRASRSPWSQPVPTPRGPPAPAVAVPALAPTAPTARTPLQAAAKQRSQKQTTQDERRTPPGRRRERSFVRRRMHERLVRPAATSDSRRGIGFDRCAWPQLRFQLTIVC